MITQEFDLNLIPNSDPVVVHVDQYDRGTGRLIISLFNGNEPYIPDGTAVIQGSKPDGRGFEYPADLEDNVVTANLTEQMTAVAGEVRTQIVVTEASGRTGTFAFTLAVQASALPSDTDMSASEYTVIQQAIEDSEAWARGSRGGVDVPVGDETYHNNSKYYADLAAQSAGQGGHVIVDGDGNEMPARPKLQFENSTVTDDALNNKTIVSTGTASGGSIVKVHTTESTLFGESVTLTDGVQTMTQTFDSNGDATFNAVMMIGNLTVESTDGTSIAVYHFTANYFGVYEVPLTFWTATIEVSTSTSAFDTLTVRAVKDGTTYGSGTFDNGSATVTVPETGEYTLVVDYLWAQYTATVNVIAETTYSTSVNGFFATVNLVTSTPEFANLPIYVTWDGDPVTGTAFSSGTATFTALEPGSYVFSVNYGGETYTATLTVTTETTYNNIEIKMWVATLTISTTSQELYGNTVTVKKEGAVVATNTLDSVTGSCVVNVHETGTYTVEVTDTIYQYTYRENAVVSAETNYPVQIDTFNATLSLTTTSPELASSQITITKGGATIGTTTFVSSSASFVVHESGTYTCSCTYLGDDYSTDVPVSTQTTYPVVIDLNITVSITVYSATEDTISWTDESGSQVATFATGASSKQIDVVVAPNGQNVTFTSSVAKDLENADLTTAYSKTVNVTSSTTTIHLMPEWTVYWYGYEDDTFSLTPTNYKYSDWGSTATAPSATRNTNSIRYTVNGNQNGSVFAGPFDMSLFNSVKILITNAEVKGGSSYSSKQAIVSTTQYQTGYSSTARTDILISTSTATISTPTFKTVDVQSQTSSQYVALAMQSVSSNPNYCEFVALWLE